MKRIMKRITRNEIGEILENIVSNYEEEAAAEALLKDVRALYGIVDDMNSGVSIEIAVQNALEQKLQTVEDYDYNGYNYSRAYYSIADCNVARNFVKNRGY